MIFIKKTVKKENAFGGRNQPVRVNKKIRLNLTVDKKLKLKRPLNQTVNKKSKLKQRLNLTVDKKLKLTQRLNLTVDRNMLNLKVIQEI